MGNCSRDPATCLTTAGTGTQTCNGDGDNLIESEEGGLAWEHLRNSGIIAGGYDGTGDGQSGTPFVLETGAPTAKIGDGIGWMFEDSHMYKTNPTPSSCGKGIGPGGQRTIKEYNLMLFQESYTGCQSSTPALTVIQASSIDDKIDDGDPMRGQVLSGGALNSVSCLTGNSYDLSTSGIACETNFSN